MTTLTLTVPDDMAREINQIKSINWSDVARIAIFERLSQLRLLETITSKSKLTEKDALDFGNKINQSLAKKYLHLKGFKNESGN